MRLCLTLALLAALPVTVFSQVTDSFQDATLVSVATAANGANCDANSTTASDTTVNCSSTEERRYTVRVGDQAYILRPKLAEVSGYQWLNPFGHDILVHQLPPAHVLLRYTGKEFKIRIGKKEATYLLVSAVATASGH